MSTDNRPQYIVAVDLEFPPTSTGLKPFQPYTYPLPAGNKWIASFRRFWKLFRLSRHSKIMILDSTSGIIQPDLLLCILMGFWRRKPIIILTGDMWNAGQGIGYSIKRTVLRLADRSIKRYVVQSHDEAKTFPHIWKVNPDKVRICLYHYTFTDEEIENAPAYEGNYIFAGGNPHRDYDILLEAARQMPDQKFIIATRRLDGRSDIPPNVEVVSVKHNEFIGLMRCAQAVVTPLRAGITRASGQQTYLNAMRMGKVNIVNGNVFGVNDYIVDGENSILTDGTPEGFVRALRWVLDPGNQAAAAEMGIAARKSVEAFNYQRHLSTMAAIVEDAITTG